MLQADAFAAFQRDTRSCKRGADTARTTLYTRSVPDTVRADRSDARHIASNEGLSVMSRTAAAAHPRKIRKAVFPVAGLGTRFLPATKAMPKEMLTVVDRPVIQHVVDEARAAGIEFFIFVTGRNKGVIEDHFDSQFELENTLEMRGKKSELEALNRDLPKAGQASFTRQQAPLGLGHAVWCARELVGNEPFALLLPDMLHHGAQPCLAEMMSAYAQHGGNHIAVQPVPEDQTHLYGICGVEDAKAKVSTITKMVEKPARGTAPSNLHITGRYILQPEIFTHLADQERGTGGEIQLTDAMIRMSQQADQNFHAVRFDGEIFDCGSKIGWLTANVAYALKRDDLAPAFKAELKKFV